MGLRRGAQFPVFVSLFATKWSRLVILDACRVSFDI